MISRLGVGKPKIVILGLGPCGLGAAWRLEELGYDYYLAFEGRATPGGLAASYTDAQGFTWDVGGHIQFSHYAYFDRLMDELLPNEWLYHERSAWIWIMGRFIPYPLQSNLRYLPWRPRAECLAGLLTAARRPAGPPANFREWILATFGAGIAEHFLLPYNEKVWAYPPEVLSWGWIGERVAVPDIRRTLASVFLKRDDRGWGPNRQFRFPKHGGSGEVWRRLFARLDRRHVHLACPVRRLKTKEKTLEFADGRREIYDILISTIPLDRLVCLADLAAALPTTALLHSSVHVIGVGLRGVAPPHLKGKCWIYFPEPDVPFYRATVFSHYSPYNVPDPARFWSLLAEVSASPYRPVDPHAVVEAVVDGLKQTNLIPAAGDIVDTWHHFEPYGYPTPTRQRDDALAILTELEARDIYSRGRFGAWKYEVSNQDHTFMQGVEVVDRLLRGIPERTVWHPLEVNAPRRAERLALPRA